MMIHPGLAALNGHWNKDEYAAGYRARLTAIPDFDGAHHCWRVGWEDADTEMLELARHRKALAEGGKTTIRRPEASYSTLAAMRE
jgi:hypothetical protein